MCEVFARDCIFHIGDVDPVVRYRGREVGRVLDIRTDEQGVESTIQITDPEVFNLIKNGPQERWYSIAVSPTERRSPFRLLLDRLNLRRLRVQAPTHPRRDLKP